MSVLVGRSARRRTTMSKVGWSALAWFVAIVFFFPVLWMALEGLKTEVQAASIPPTILFMPTLSAIQEVLSRDFPPYLINSATATLGSTLLVLVLGLPAAYALSIRPVKRTRDVLFFSWNEFFYAVNFTSSIAATSPIFLVGFISGRGLFYAKLAAAATLASLPVLLAGWVAQKQLIRGLTMGAVK